MQILDDIKNIARRRGSLSEEDFVDLQRVSRQLGLVRDNTKFKNLRLSKGGVVSKKNLNFLKKFHNTVVEEGRERLEGDDTGPESVTTMRIIGLSADFGDGEKEYLLPSYDPKTKEVLDPEGKSKEEREIIYQKIMSKFLPAILDGQIEGYNSEKKAEEDRKKIYKNIIGR